MKKQVKALAAAFVAFVATIFAVYLGQDDPIVLMDAGTAFGVALATWIGTWFAPKNQDA